VCVYVYAISVWLCVYVCGGCGAQKASALILKNNNSS